jgi:hypothetical protein
VYVIEHFVVAVIPLKLQYPANDPLPVVVIVTSPDGAVGLEEVSVTVTEQMVPEPLPMTTVEGEQLTLVVVVLFGRGVTVSVKD